MSIISDSNKAQQVAIQHENGPQLIVAGAGTGKTRVITARIAYLITEKNLNVDEVLALTFTEKAAEEMEERVDQMLPYGYVDLWISTFHAFCDKVLKQHALDIGLPNNYKLLDQTEAWLLVRKNLDRFSLDYYKPMGNPSKFIHALLSHFSRCKDEGIEPEDYLKHAEEVRLNSDSTDFVKTLDLPADFDKLERKKQQEYLSQGIIKIEEVANAYHVYQQLLLENEALDFGDLIAYAIKLFKKRPLLLEKYRKQFKYILVDEFQDTNFVQYELIKLLAAPKNNITVVGDDDQSIYKFRGASISNIMQFKEDYPDAKEVVLNDNYRSAQEILDKAYEFIKQNDPNRLEVKLGINKKLKSNLEEKGVIEHLHEKTIDDEAQAVVGKIVEFRNDNKAEWSDFAILVRANDNANIFINYLDQAQIPYQFLAMRGLYSKPVVMDVLSYFKLLDNYHESPAVYRMLNLPFLGLTSDQIVKIVHFSKRKSVSLFEALRQIGSVPGIEQASIGIVNKLLKQVDDDTKMAQTKKPTEILLSFVYGSGYLDYLKNLDDQTAKENMSYLQQFLQKIKSLEITFEDPRLSDLTDVLELEMQAGESGRLAFDVETGPDMVKIMTVHSAKGLEFDYVFLPNMVDRKFPTDERREAIEIPDALIQEQLPEGNFHLEEERRLFYVAMTRAKKGLFFSSAENYGGARKKKLSRFLVELGYERAESTKAPVVSAMGGALRQAQGDKIGEIKTGQYVYEVPKRFSFSQIAAYEKCPLQYKYANVLKIPVFGNHYFTFGTTIHNSLQKYLEQSFKIANTFQADLFGSSETKRAELLPIEDLYKIYDENWLNDWYEDEAQREKYYKRGKELLKNFYDDFHEEKPEVKLLELPFKLKIGQNLFMGRIDRVDQLAEGKVEIVDYKTGQAKDGKLNTDDRRQLLFYQIAAEEALGLKVEKLTYHYLEGNIKAPFVGKDADKVKLKQRFVDNVEAIRQQKFEPTPSEFVCKGCPFKDICEHRKM
jgi:DNA helicase II / ATP-dependent DNA helicase PcrA